MPRSDDSTTPAAGIYRKFTVMRTDGSSEQGGKHEYCSYFVLDWEHDPFAVPAALAYASACEATYPELAKDLRDHARAHAPSAPAQEVAPPVPPGPRERPHLIDGEFQSDKYPTCPRGKVPLSTKDVTAQDLLWTYAQRRRAVDPDFAADLEAALKTHGYERCRTCGGRGSHPRCPNCPPAPSAERAAPPTDAPALPTGMKEPVK